MPEIVGLVDTGVMCCWLEVPGRATAGGGAARWDNARANREIDTIINMGGTLVLATSVVIETANHVANSAHSRHLKATQLFERVLSSISGRHPWRQFAENERLWNQAWYDKAAAEWPNFADRQIGLADYSLADIARYFNSLGSEVRTLTTDTMLAAEVGHLPAIAIPRRRRRE